GLLGADDRRSWLPMRPMLPPLGRNGDRLGAPQTGRDKRLRVGLVMEPAGIHHPYTRGAYLGLERAVRELEITGRVLTPAPKEGYIPSLSLLARQRYDVVIATGVIATGVFTASALDRVATEFPGTRFAIIDASHDTLAHRPPNVLGLAFREEQA